MAMEHKFLTKIEEYSLKNVYQETSRKSQKNNQKSKILQPNSEILPITRLIVFTVESAENDHQVPSHKYNTKSE